MFYDFPQRITDDPLPLADSTVINSATRPRRTFITAHHGGSWDDPATWNVIGTDGGILPGSDDDIIVAHQIMNSNADVYCRDFVLGRWGYIYQGTGRNYFRVHCRNVRLDGTFSFAFDIYPTGKIYEQPAGIYRPRYLNNFALSRIRNLRLSTKQYLINVNDGTFGYPLQEVYFDAGSAGSILRNWSPSSYLTLLQFQNAGTDTTLFVNCNIETSVLYLLGTLDFIFNGCSLSTATFQAGNGTVVHFSESVVRVTLKIQHSISSVFEGTGSVVLADGANIGLTVTAQSYPTYDVKLVVEGYSELTGGNPSAPAVRDDLTFLKSPRGIDGSSTLKVNTDYPSKLFFHHEDQPFAIGNLDATSAMSTCVYDLDGDQEVKGTTYYNLELGGSGIKKLMGDVTVINDYSLTGTATLDLNGFTLTT